MATRLSKLRMDEISGVDEGANQLPGWIVQKSADFKDQLETFEKSVVSIYDALTDDISDLYFADAPSEVQKARDLVAEWVEDGLVFDDEEDSDAVRKSVLDRFRDIFGTDDPVTKEASADEDVEDEEDAEDEEDEVAKTTDSEDVVEEEAADEDVEDEEDAEDEDVAKALSEQSERIEKALEDSIEPLREAILSIADRTENLEKHAAGRTSLPGQEVREDGEEKATGLQKAIGAAVTGRKVKLR